MNKGVFAAIALLMAAASLTATAQLISQYSFHNSAGVNGVGVSVFSDVACTVPLTSISWGMLNPDSSATYTIYVKNTGPSSATLTMTTSTWNPPEASAILTVSWDREGQVLSSSEVFAAIITLTVSASATGIASISFDITITGTHSA